MTRRAVVSAGVLIVLFGGLVAVPAAVTDCGSTECTPDAYGFSDGERIEPSALLSLSQRPCVKPGIELVSSEARLVEVWAQFSSSNEAGATVDGGMPTVDFSRQRVVVREGLTDEGVSWSVRSGDSVVFGLLACGGPPR